MQHPNGQETLHYFSSTNRLDEVGKSDVVMLLVKTWQTPRAVEQAKRILSSTGIAVTLQNGLGNLQAMASYIGDERAIQGITSDGAMMIEPGLVRHAGHGLTHIAMKEGRQELISRLVMLLNSAGFNTKSVESTDSLIWGKLAVNAGINPLTALLQVTNGVLANYPSTRDLMCGAAEETAATARAQGIELPYKSASERVMEVAQATAQNRSSMAQDITRGMPTEIDSISGAIVKIARNKGVETPINQALFTLIKSQIKTGEWRSSIELLPQPLKAKIEAIIPIARK